MTYEFLSLDVQSGIGTITIERPKMLNALSSEVLLELGSLLREVEKSNTIDVLIITGSGEKAFVAGADISEMKDKNAISGKKFSQEGNNVFAQLANLTQPTIACINGFALGGGCELALACDIRLASTNAKFGQPEVGLGIVPGFGGTQRLPRLVGAGIAKELIFTGKVIGTDEAHRIGLVNHVYNQDELLEEGMKLAKSIQKNAYLAVTSSKAVIDSGLDMSLENGLKYEAEVFGALFATNDQKEGMDAFVNKRKPNFTKD
ncbi:enoyl-CoA hydratase-related protein [Vagococcus fluvialis]|uniref:enoyl-CoA hydratase-related protein n=1 Tax=Vagococcus fluvialis TaxID=2738 RepID=UPI001432E45F|nr:enoyl-CoA hydratase-related protein [Vagococcus fluvialis]MBO0487544.1 enoyl-CoA hydratase/isomerase family protein [Vagococcus fluvialis]NKC58640.1 crotonase [Vagococcus fluvialis]NKD49128.1 crotonase [Vagococcus fluvialis]